MRGISKKMFISILTSVIVMVTMVATTFAWVGIFTYANTDNFSLNLKTVGLDSYYYLTISNTGKRNTFSDTIEQVDIKRQILDNRYDNKYQEYSNDVIESIFSLDSLQSVSTYIGDDNRVDNNFYKLNVNNQYDVNFVNTNEFYKFDVYISVDTKEGIGPDTTGIDANVKLSNISEILHGSKSTYRCVNNNPLKNLPSNIMNDLLKNINDTDPFTINSKNAFRFSMSVYEPIVVDEEYNENDLPLYSLIYQGGSQTPNYDELNDVYDFGGILDSEHNLASKELLSVRSIYGLSNKYYDKLENTINRRNNDLELIQDNDTVWDKTKHSKYLGCFDGIQTKMKITICMWFEGWDSDCIKAIEEKSIALDLAFETDKIN